MKTTKEKPLSKFIEDRGLTVRFTPTHVSQDESEYKTWRLHYAAMITNREGKTESFTWNAGYGCAVQALRGNLNKWLLECGRAFGEARHLHDATLVAVFKPMVSAGRIRDQAEVRKVIEFLLKKYQPEAADLMNGLKLDASLGEYSFEEFCGELGYDSDSRKAERSWRDCQENGRKLRALIGAAGFAELLNETESL